MEQFSRVNIPIPQNESCRDYDPNSKEAKEILEECRRLREEFEFEVPIIINGKEIRTEKKGRQPICSDHKKTLCTFSNASEEIVNQAIEGALEAKKKWMNLPFHSRASIFLKAADLISGKYRTKLLAATMLGQGKNIWQAEIDVIGEACDFLRFNTYYAQKIYERQPEINPKTIWNTLEWRPLEGYVVAITPFNFVAIGLNLPTSPALMGNVVVWKPGSTSIYANYLMYKILEEAGLPSGVIQFVPGMGRQIGNTLINNKNFSGIHFTGSTATFKKIWLQTAENTINLYKNYPRIVGETGGKNFHIYHKDFDFESGINGIIRSAFEYQGQKCSACSRAYIPESIWEKFQNKLVDEVSKIKVGQSDDLSVFMTAVIDQKSFNRIKGYIDEAKEDKEVELVCGGKYDDSEGYYIYPTIYKTTNPKHKLLQEEIFGPVLTVYVYPDEKFIETLHLADQTSPYALTGSIYCTDRELIVKATEILRYSAGNFYINCKSTGSVVGQQPFGGHRASGNNQKAGAMDNLQNWVTPRSIKESFSGLKTWKYNHMLVEKK
ncbi:delta-1-pyrroline-5-carboxylate dehydrogenase 1 [Anaeramoeba flamelloides]|uniref:Multifunctional fusion protein n=1 Tax=Anaeramoeba flamelloides TaxID=1746091 RepID=A0AAV7YD05_9EUKA|nr:delta-1-pyrroline-5-carboxylate dehydrogenase 1 isoform a-related [Anaeramoeba flamelloides]KAJ6235097.1 delta-1-pyrroline-5-carboxylate dehydrogenase 1 [Anaeramoeba flamelloides]